MLLKLLLPYLFIIILSFLISFSLLAQCIPSKAGWNKTLYNKKLSLSQLSGYSRKNNREVAHQLYLEKGFNITDLADVPDLSDFKNLKYLWISNKSVLPKEIVIEKISSLEALRLDTITNINIDDLLMKLSILPKLRILELRNCNISNIPKTITQLKNLQYLDLSYNDKLLDRELSIMVNYLIQLPKLEIILLDYNQFKNLPDNIVQMKQLKCLSMTGINLDNKHISSSVIDFIAQNNIEIQNTSLRQLIKYRVEQFNKDKDKIRQNQQKNIERQKFKNISKDSLIKYSLKILDSLEYKDRQIEILTKTLESLEKKHNDTIKLVNQLRKVEEKLSNSNQELSNLNQELSNLNQELSTKERLLTVVALLSTCLFILTSWLLYISIRAVKRYYVKERDLAMNKLELGHTQTNLDKEKQSTAKIISGLVHDFQNPLHSIIVDSIPSETDIIENLRKKLEHINENAKRIERLRNIILSRQKIKEGQLKLNYSNEYLWDIVNEAFKFSETLLNQKEIIYENNIHKDLRVWVDKEQILRVFDNLIGNSIKYTLQKGTIKVESRAKNNNKVEISVIDNGIGIYREEQKNIFDEYYSSDKSKSIGIGLHFCKSIITMHGCYIKVNSEERGGTEFYFTLPILKSDTDVYPKTEKITQSKTYFVKLNREEKLILKDYISLLRETPHYAISRIDNILNSIPTSITNENIRSWKRNIQESAITDLKNEYNELIKQ
jgi:signal transduction histidine kinase